MESLIVPLITFVTGNPAAVAVLGVVDVVLLMLVYKYVIARILRKVEQLEEVMKVHVTDSLSRGQQTEQIKDSMNELKGLLTAMTFSNQGLK